MIFGTLMCDCHTFTPNCLYYIFDLPVSFANPFSFSFKSFNVVVAELIYSHYISSYILIMQTQTHKRNSLRTHSLRDVCLCVVYDCRQRPKIVIQVQSVENYLHKVENKSNVLDVRVANTYHIKPTYRILVLASDGSYSLCSDIMFLLK